VSEKYIPKFAPYTAQELVDSGWVERVRAAIVKDGNAIRIGGDRSIICQVINEPHRWMPIMLPNGGTQLIDFAQCMLVADMLEGAAPIPPKTPQPE
jgi:hypothetical protein